MAAFQMLTGSKDAHTKMWTCEQTYGEHESSCCNNIQFYFYIYKCDFILVFGPYLDDQVFPLAQRLSRSKYFSGILESICSPRMN